MGLVGSKARWSFSFGGAMYAWPFMCGVAKFIQERDLLHDEARLYATSAGVVPAVLLACDIDVERQGLRAAMASNDEHVLDARLPFGRPSIVRDSLNTFGSILPADAHERASGRVFISLTRLPRLRREFVSRFEDRRALLDAMAGTMAIPGHGVWLALRSAHHGWCLDGGLLPGPSRDDRTDWNTLRVSIARPGSGTASHRLLHPSQPISLKMVTTVAPRDRRLALFEQGYEDARRHWERHRWSTPNRVVLTKRSDLAAAS